jgi:copper transport protein
VHVVNGSARRRRVLPLGHLSRLRGAALGAIAIAVALFALPATVVAHAGVVRTTPADGQRFDVAPTTFEIQFSEVIGVDPDGVRLVDVSGEPVDLPPARADGVRVIQALPSLADGWYLASWSVVSADGHVVHGAIAFGVGDVTGPPPAVSTADPGAAILGAARAIADLGLLVTVGAAAAWVLLGAHSGRVRRAAIAAGIMGALGSLAVAGLTWSLAGDGAFAGGALPATLLRAGLLLAVAGAVAAGRVRLALALGAGAVATMAIGGHPGQGLITAGLLVVHLAAAAAWLGAAPAVLLALVDPRTADPDALRIVRRFSRLSTVTLFVVIGAGSALAVMLADASLEGLDPRYATMLAAKVALVGLAAILGAFTRRRLARETPSRADLRRVFAVDTALLVAVVALSAGLTIGPPRPAATPDDDLHVGHCTIQTDEGTVNVSLVPGRVGENTLYVDGTGELESAAAELRLRGEDGAIEIALEPSATGWTGAGTIPVAGAWNVTVIMGVDMFTIERAGCELRVEP